MGSGRAAETALASAAVWLFAGVLLSLLAVHHPATGWNVNSRLALVFAVVDDRTFSIDYYHDLPELETMDKAFFGGRYYSDKVFGVSLLAVPAYAATRLALGFAGYRPGFQLSHYVMRAFAVSVPAALGAALLFRLLALLGAAPRRALLAVLLVVYGTMWYGYGAVFYPYLPGVAAMLGALWMLLRPRDGGLGPGTAAGIGFLCGFAILCDFLFGPLVLMFGLVFVADLVRSRPGWRGGAAAVLSGAAAGSVPLLLFVAYSVSIFGTPTIPYEYEASERFREGMAQGVMGITAPRLSTLFFVTLHPFRGLFFWSPVLLAALAGAVAMGLRSGRDRIVGAYALAGVGAYLLINAGYYMWWGGWAMGPRLVLPAFAALPLGLAWLCRPRAWAFWAVLALGIVSVALTMPVALLDPQVPQGNPDGVLDAAAWGTPLHVPQFVYLRAFYELAVFRTAEGALDAWRLLSFGGAALSALAGGLLADRILRRSADL